MWENNKTIYYKYQNYNVYKNGITHRYSKCTQPRCFLCWCFNTAICDLRILFTAWIYNFNRRLQLRSLTTEAYVVFMSWSLPLGSDDFLLLPAKLTVTSSLAMTPKQTGQDEPTKQQSTMKEQSELLSDNLFRQMLPSKGDWNFSNSPTTNIAE